MEFVTRLKPFLYQTVLLCEISPCFYDLQPRCFDLPCYPVFMWLFWYIVWEKEEALDISGDEIWPRISDPQKWMRKETPGVLCRDKWFHTWLTRKDFVQAFSPLFCNTGWEVLQKSISLWRLSGLIYLLKICVAVFRPALAVCTSGTCAGKGGVGSWGRYLSISACPSHLQESPLDVSHEPFSYLRVWKK